MINGEMQLKIKGKCGNDLGSIKTNTMRQYALRTGLPVHSGHLDFFYNNFERTFGEINGAFIQYQIKRDMRK
jgi:hypothetical protein